MGVGGEGKEAKVFYQTLLQQQIFMKGWEKSVEKANCLCAFAQK